MQLSDKELAIVWDKVIKLTHFKPSTNPEVVPFQLDMNYKIYKIGAYSPEAYNLFAINILHNITPKDAYVYALDWQHAGYKYNPHKEDHLMFYPDGDYYFFFAEDFSWGYLSHPWQKTAWIYGDELIEMISTCAQLWHVTYLT